MTEIVNLTYFCQHLKHVCIVDIIIYKDCIIVQLNERNLFKSGEYSLTQFIPGHHSTGLRVICYGRRHGSQFRRRLSIRCLHARLFPPLNIC